MGNELDVSPLGITRLGFLPFFFGVIQGSSESFFTTEETWDLATVLGTTEAFFATEGFVAIVASTVTVARTSFPLGGGTGTTPLLASGIRSSLAHHSISFFFLQFLST